MLLQPFGMDVVEASQHLRKEFQNYSMRKKGYIKGDAQAK